jgi:hypothetical protein
MGDGSTKIRVITKTTAYMYAEYNSTLDTQKYGATFSSDNKGFDELGTSYIPLDAIFATIPIIRVHHGLEPEDGFTVFPDWQNSQTMKDMRQAMDLFGSAFDALWAEYMKQKYRAPFATAWSKTGAASPGIPMNIKWISEFPLGAGTFQNFRKSLEGNKSVTGSAAKLPNMMKVRQEIAARSGNPLAGLKPVSKS